MSEKSTSSGQPPILVFTDGAALGNPGPGGWGAVVDTGDGDILELGGRSEKDTTNNRMEMAAAIEAIKVLSRTGRPMVIHTDSSYLCKGITSWIGAWRRRGWTTSEGKPVLNQDLWIELENAVQGLSIRWVQVPGHSGVRGNERADRIATEFARGRDPELFAGKADSNEAGLAVAAGGERKPRKKTKSGPGLAYLSLVKGVLKRHSTWAECEARVKGVSGARFQKVMSEDEIPVVLKKWGVGPGRFPA